MIRRKPKNKSDELLASLRNLPAVISNSEIRKILTVYSSDDIGDILIVASDSYYNKSTSIIPDHVFDVAKDYLTEIDSGHPALKTIGASVGKHSEWKKAKHNISMSSLNKVNKVEEFKSWATGIGGKYSSIQDKLDGISIDLEYNSGILEKAITRGNGSIGEDIYLNVKNMQGVKMKIDGFTGSLKAEIFLFMNDFDRINELIRKYGKGEDELSNPRNAASGIAKKRKDGGKYSEYLSVLFYDIVSDDLDFETETEKMEYIKSLGLKVCFYKKVTLEEAIQVYKDFEDHLRNETPYDIDGLVVKTDSLELQRKHGLLGGNPKAQIAWKFEAAKAETILNDIEWSLGRNGRVTPIAKVKPVQIGGVVVRNVSLHNLGIFEKLHLGKGDTVQISRRNDVIPYLEKVVKSTGNYFEAPKFCPSCDSELKIEKSDDKTSDAKFLVCENLDCEALKIGGLNKWIYVLDIKSIGPKIIDLLFNNKLISDPADFYLLKPHDISLLDRMGDRSAHKILEKLHAKKVITLPEFIGGLNIKNFGQRTAEAIVEAGYDTVEEMINLTKTELVRIPGIEEKTASQITDGLNSKLNLIKKLQDVGIKIKEAEKVEIKSDKLEGLTFCFTGAIQRNDSNGDRYTREMMQQLVVENSGELSNVKKGLSYLVMADPNSTKNKAKKARDIGINILSEDKFFEMVGV